MRNTTLLLALSLATLAGACKSPGNRPDPSRAVVDERVEGTSLLGLPLVRPELEPDVRAARLADLAEAEAALRADPADEDAAIWYGRRLAYLGRYRDAIEAFSAALEEHPESYRLRRHRGHRWISVRELELAVLDLTRAVELAALQPDRVEPDGMPNAAGIPTSTDKSNIDYHLGLAHYLLGDMAEAVRIYRRCMESSRHSDDMLCATSHWLYMSLRRLGYRREADQVASAIREDMDILENHAYHELLLLYQGERDADELLARATGEADGIQNATMLYGLANWHLVNGDARRAAEIYRTILSGDAWAAFGYIAAEADVQRLGPFLAPASAQDR